MRIIVVSDTHGSYQALEDIIERNKPIDMLIFLGDGERELDNIRALYPDINIYQVAGNCDYMSMAPTETLIDAGKYRIFACHGHSLGVKSSLEPLKDRARRCNARIALFGHTHCRFESYEDGLYIMNPGSAGCPRDGKRPSYGFIDITDSGIVTNTVSLY